MTTPGDIAQRVAGLRRPLLVAIDVDGTISPIVDHPDDARIESDALDALWHIANVPEVHVALVTGRDLASLRRMESLPDVWRVVEHGGLIVPPGGDGIHPPLSEERERALSAVDGWLRHNAAHLEGVVIERKARGVALHTRKLAAIDAHAAEALLDQFEAEASAQGLHTRRGRQVREAQADRHSKAVALASLLERLDANAMFFAGDDLTDFEAIELAYARGVGAFVRSDERRTEPAQASAIWSGVDDVVAFLQALVVALR